MDKIRITVQVLNGSTGEVRELTANVAAIDEQEAVNTLFTKARKDDYYYRFLGHNGILNPINDRAKAITHHNQTYWELEG